MPRRVAHAVPGQPGLLQRETHSQKHKQKTKAKYKGKIRKI